MTRLVLLAILCVVTWLYFPETRAILLEAAQPVVLRVGRWSSNEEMAQVGRHAVDHERLTGELPHGETWLGWLATRYPDRDAAQDPWGSHYQLIVWDDSVAVLSYGPDRTRDTDDDFQVVAPRG